MHEECIHKLEKDVEQLQDKLQESREKELQLNITIENVIQTSKRLKISTTPIVTVIRGGMELISGHRIRWRDTNPVVSEWQECDL